MTNKKKKTLYSAILSLATFILWTCLIRFVDVRPIGPLGSSVGLATLNRFVHGFTGVHMMLYTITDLLGLIPVGLMFFFAVVGIFRLIQRKSLARVDRSILFLGVFYVVVLILYLFFEEFVINYRPVLINGRLEASYPSSTTLLVLCVIPTSKIQFSRLIKNTALRRTVNMLLTAFMVFMVAARLVSGVHWFSDILGGIFLSFTLVKLYNLTD